MNVAIAKRGFIYSRVLCQRSFLLLAGINFYTKVSVEAAKNEALEIRRDVQKSYEDLAIRLIRDLCREEDFYIFRSTCGREACMKSSASKYCKLEQSRC